ncbi:hypothetical protein GGS21DRAFT_496702 [Xylaria nigripes]|nr:hypothetical protein GGS21DRAFT_496702 [Xylaria nigripes]
MVFASLISTMVLKSWAVRTGLAVAGCAVDDGHGKRAWDDFAVLEIGTGGTVFLVFLVEVVLSVVTVSVSLSRHRVTICCEVAMVAEKIGDAACWD